MRGPIYITGPTASGKSDVALCLAERIGGEIISVDSMQVYQGLDIGTAKPSPAERARVPHHLLDVVPLTAEFDAAQYLRLARVAEAEIRRRGKVPIFCGGTGLYLKALAAGIGSAPPANAALRASLEKEPMEVLLSELREKDPATFSRIDQENPRRVIRAVEVLRLTSKPFSAQKGTWDLPQPPGIWVGLSRERSDLISRIERRVDEMFARGLVKETRALLDQGLEQNRTAMQAIGYRQVAAHLRGECDLPATIELVKQKTRQFAKRQLTWFRRQLELIWIEIKPDASTDFIADEILSLPSSR